MGTRPTAVTRPDFPKGERKDLNGWIYLHIQGSARERGWWHGYLLAPEIREALRCIRYLIMQDTGVEFEWFARNAAAMFANTLATNFNGKLTDDSGVEIMEELEGIVSGVNANPEPRTAPLALAELIGWNAYPEMICQWWPGVIGGQLKPAIPLPKSRSGATDSLSIVRQHSWHHFNHSCSAFVAVGKYTADGEVVIAQTTWQRFANGDAYNVILDLELDKGSRLIMQSVPGYVHSSTDFWLTGAGLGVAETSINGTGFDPAGLPEFFRARRASQYADSIRGWRELFRFGNNGGYTNSWLLADVNRREISAYELTLNYESLQPIRRSGYYVGCNIPQSLQVRNLGCPQPSGFDNILSSGARRVRFEQLMEEHRGRIDAEVAKAILGDHYDVYLRSEHPSSRTICGHIDNDDARFGSGGHGPFYPWGSLDAKVTAGPLARELKLLARWGRACGIPFKAADFFSEHPQYAWLRRYTKDRPSQPWMEFPVRE
jgi:phospholipase B-like protein